MLKTQLSVRQIQLGLYNSGMFDRRSFLMLTNASWGFLPYEADFIAISPSRIATEVEIKRSIEDLRADYKKGHRHDSDRVTYFFFCVPEGLVTEAENVILEKERELVGAPIEEKDCPALLCYNENGKIFGTGFGKAKRFGTHKVPLEDYATAGRLASLRFWNLLEKTASPEDRGLQKRMREVQEENKVLKLVNRNIEEDYNMLKQMLRYRYPALWEEFLEIGHSTDQETSQQKTMDAIESRKDDFIEDIIFKYNLKGKEGVEIRTKAVCQNSLGNAHPTDDLITEILYKDHLIAMIYQRRDELNWTETNCIDFKPLFD